MILLSEILMGLGLFFFFGTAVGLLRFPDFYTRMHAAGKGDTLSSLLMLLSMIVYVCSDIHHLDVATFIVAVKIFMIILFVYIGSPTATHALTVAAHKMGVEYWRRPEK